MGGGSGRAEFVKFPHSVMAHMQRGLFVPIHDARGRSDKVFARLEGPSRAETVLLLHGVRAAVPRSVGIG